MKIVVQTLGCKVNQYESDALIFGLRQAGHDAVQNLCFADVYILNTCAVTNMAERKSRQYISKFNSLNPNCKILVCGCASQINAKQFENLKNVIYISGNANKQRIINEITNYRLQNTNSDKHLKNSSLSLEGCLREQEGRVVNSQIQIDENPCAYEDYILPFSSNTRAHIKIQEGCNRYCSYCIIPHIRGKSRSRDIISILKEAEELIKNSVKEIVLTGIDLSDYKIDNKIGLITLLKELDKFNALIRLGSMEAGLLTESFLKKLIKIKNFCPHFHLSLQSGSNSVLKRMNRHYTKEEFIEITEKIRRNFENANITTDVIVGFPDETDAEFEETLETIKKANFSYMHIFPYSVRNGTAAQKMLEKKLWKEVPKNIVKQREETLKKLNSLQFEKFINSCKNKKFNMLIEQFSKGYYTGHTENFIKCYLNEKNLELNTIVQIEISEKFKDGAVVHFARQNEVKINNSGNIIASVAKQSSYK